MSNQNAFACYMGGVWVAALACSLAGVLYGLGGCILAAVAAGGALLASFGWKS